MKTYGPKWLGLSRYIPYPIRAVKLSIDINPFGFWLKPDWKHKKDLSEFARSQGETIWWFRWLWLQISYSRWL